MPAQKIFGKGKVNPAPAQGEKPKPKLYSHRSDLDRQEREKWSWLRLWCYTKCCIKGNNTVKNFGVRHEIKQMSAEARIMFLFTLLVGSFLVAGGAYLIVHGQENYVIDLIVVGVVGITIGVTFCFLGLVPMLKVIFCTKHEVELPKENQQDGIEDGKDPKQVSFVENILVLADDMSGLHVPLDDDVQRERTASFSSQLRAPAPTHQKDHYTRGHD